MTNQGRFSPYVGGFSLLELMLVLLLLGLVYGLAGPMLNGGSAGLEMKAAARQLAAGLRKARSVAVTERRDAWLSLDVEKRTFSVTGDAKTYTMHSRLDFTLYTAESEVVKDGIGNIHFFPDGSSTGGRITLGIGGDKQEVDVDWLTGRVKIL
jgi:general secretion pathway protein H